MIETDKVFDNGKKWEANVRGQYKTMGKKSEIQELKELVIEGFNNVNNRLGVLEQDMKEVKKRLDNVEEDWTTLDIMMSTSTMMSEIK